ncbi:MAG: CPBP family intramembrane metalloprotease [Burkholderiales bacterium]|nr:CPBP family intramembrane metalloprotease [Burkholderiales bacterium]
MQQTLIEKNSLDVTDMQGLDGVGDAARPAFNWRGEIRELIDFLRKPVRGSGRVIPLSQGWRRIALLLGVRFCFVLLVALPINTALQIWGGIEYDQATQTTSFAIWGVIGAPLLEELIFRAGLRQAKYSLFICPVLVCQFSRSALVVAVMATIVLSIAAIDALRLRWNPPAAGFRFTRGRAFIRCFPLIFWIYAIGFGLVHISNYYSGGGHSYLLVFAVSAQMFSGVLLGYLRLRQGLPSSMVMHALNNAIIFIPALLLG